MEVQFQIGDRVRETRSGAIQHEQWRWSGVDGRSRALKEGVIVKLSERFLVDGRDALIRWSDGTETWRVASGRHLTKVSPFGAIKSPDFNESRFGRDPVDPELKNYFSPGERVIETRARCIRRQQGLSGMLVARQVGVVMKWSDDNVNVIIQWDKTGRFWGVPKKVLALKSEILRVEDSNERDPEVVCRLIKSSGSNPPYTWTAWSKDDGYIAANSESEEPTNIKHFKTKSELREFVQFLKRVGYQEVDSFGVDPRELEDDSSYYSDEEEEGSSFLTEDQIARWEEMDDYPYWSGDPDWDNR